MDAIERFQREVNVPIAKVLEAGEEFIVLLDYYEAGKAHQWENLFRLRRDGSVVWKLCTPSSSDIFVGVDWSERRLVAWTWEGFILKIDESSGAILESTWTK